MKKTIFILITLSFASIFGNILTLTGSSGTTAPLSQLVLSESSASAYHNPALLFQAQNGFSMGFQTLGKLLYINYGERPESADISGNIYNASDLERKPLATKDLPERGGVSPRGYEMYMTIGMVKEIIPEYWVIGMHLAIPVNSFQKQNPFYPDEREQYFTNSLHFEMFGDAIQSARFGFGTAVQFFPQMQFGLGFSTGSKSVAQNTVFMQESGGHDSAFINTELTVNNFVIPYFAIAGKPLEQLLLTVTLHLKAISTVNTENKIRFWGEESENSISQYGVSYARDFDPLTVGFGGAYTFKLSESFELDLGAGASFHYWKNYKSRHNQDIEREFNNSWSAMAGTVLKYNRTSVSLDGRFVQTPVPDQTGRTNFVDNNRIGFALGLNQSLPAGPICVGFGADFQVHHLIHRSVNKNPDDKNPVIDEFPDSYNIKDNEFIEESAGFQTNNPGWPGFSSGGWLLSGGISLFVEF